MYVFDYSVYELLIYLRKSRADRNDETIEEVLARHEKELQEYAIKTFGERIPEKNIYREVVSGETIDERPEVQKLMRRIESPDIKGILIIDPQRLSRGDWEDGGKILSTFKYTNTLIYTPRKTYDLHITSDYKLFKMELSQGHEYLEYTKQILNDGRIRSVMAGYYVGNKTPYGYDRVPLDKRFTLVPNKDADTVRLIFDLYVNKRLGYGKIALKLDEMGLKPKYEDEWSPATIKNMLENIHYIGYVKWNNRQRIKVYEDGVLKKSRPINRDYIKAKGLHPAIIDEETFNKAQELLGKNTREKKFKEIKNPIASLGYCANCGSSLTLRPYKNKGVEYCEPRLLCRNQHKCGIKSVRASVVMKIITEVLKLKLNDFEIKYKADDRGTYDYHQNIINNLEKELEKIEIKQNELYDLLEDKTYTKEIFLVRNKKLAQERDNVTERLNKAKETAPPKPVSYEEYITTFSEVIDSLNDTSIPAKAKNNLLKEIIERIEYTNEKVGSKKITDENVQIHIKFKSKYN